jgi:glyoxylase I family protein
MATPPDPAPALLGLHHVAIIASDRDRALAFYAGTLGLVELARTWRAERASWKIDLALPGGGQIELFTFPAAPPRPSRPEAQGLRHLALAVADLDAWTRHLAAQGHIAEPLRTDPLTGARFTFVADPDGLPVELVERTAGVAPPAPAA